jgi:hypothetical protein
MRARALIALAGCWCTLSAAAPPDLSGVWMPETKRTQQMPRPLPLTPKVQAAVDLERKTYDEHLDDAGRNCLPYGMPQSMLGTAAYPHEIIQQPQRVTLLFELHMGVRRIHLDGRTIPADAMPTRMGYSVGRWEGSTLVVETAALMPQTSGFRRSARMKITERFELLTGPNEPKGKSLRVQVTIDDPETYTRPLTVNKYYTYGTGEFEMGEYFCTEDLWQQIYSGNDSRIPWR